MLGETKLKTRLKVLKNLEIFKLMLCADWLIGKVRHLASINLKILQRKTVLNVQLSYTFCNLTVQEASILSLHWQGHE